MYIIEVFKCYDVILTSSVQGKNKLRINQLRRTNTTHHKTLTHFISASQNFVMIDDKMAEILTKLKAIDFDPKMTQ